MARVNASGVKKYLQSNTGIGKQMGRVEEVGNAAFNAGPRLAGSVAADVTAAGARAFNKAMPLTKKVEPSMGNLWTGRKEGRGAIAAAAVIGAGYGLSSYKVKHEYGPRLGETTYGGTAPIMNADGVGSTSQAPTLGASGNMVLGLHNARKG